MGPRWDLDRAARHSAQQQEAARRKALAAAMSTLKTCPGFPAAQLRAMDEVDALSKSSVLPFPHLPSPDRLEYAIKMIDIHAAAFLPLVSDMSIQEAYVVMLSGLVEQGWNVYRGAAAIDPVPGNKPLAAIQERIRHWHKEGFRRLTQLTEPQAPVRRGYRKEVRAWMKFNDVKSVQAAAKLLRVSDSTLKSIMTDKGDVRYSIDTLKIVLDKIRLKSGE